MGTLNPYQAPAANLDGPEPGVVCPGCGGQASERVNFTWWGGALGPRIFNVVRCTGCKTKYNGKTGGRLGKSILLYQGIALLVGAVAFLVVFALS